LRDPCVISKREQPQLLLEVVKKYVVVGLFVMVSNSYFSPVVGYCHIRMVAVAACLIWGAYSHISGSINPGSPKTLLRLLLLCHFQPSSKIKVVKVGIVSGCLTKACVSSGQQR